MKTASSHWDVFRKIAPYFGRVVPARFIQRTEEAIPGVQRVHNLIEGIYKPADSTHALAIASMLKNPYADRIEYNPDRTWYFYYSPKIGSLDSAVNRSVFNCMRDGEPVLVLKQLSDKTHAKGARYRILGLGTVDDFDVANKLFKIGEVTIEAFQKSIDPNQTLSDDLIDTALQLEALEAWSPFVSEDRAVYQVSKTKRDAAFRRIVLENYANTCAISRSSFALGTTIEAQAAHIIPKEANGTDDPRNGVAMSHTTHWAFDRGIFTISDQYEIIIHPMVTRAVHRNFELLDLASRQIHLPQDESYLPHQEALLWHKEEVFGRFQKS
jgi:predicted restriction endonuclease